MYYNNVKGRDKIKALITGASSGIGSEMAKYLDKLGYSLILVARREDRLLKLAKTLKNAKIICLDLGVIENNYKLYEMTKDENINLLINNAGFGLYGNFFETSLESELNMVDLNIKSLHILNKLFLKDFMKKDSGRILNVASSAGFMAGPLMSTYYGTKNYVYRLSQGIFKELKKAKSNVKISVLCPGPVDTEFNSVANVSFNLKGLKSDYVAKLAIDKTLKNKFLIVPGVKMKLGKFALRLIPDSLMLSSSYFIQNKKG